MDLVSRMISPNPAQRPRANHVLAHPYFWSASHKLDFLSELSQRILAKDMLRLKKNLDRLLASDGSPLVGESWDCNLDPVLLTDLINSTSTKYDFSLVSECVKMIRNKRSHRGENADLHGFLLDDNNWFAYIDHLFPELFMKCIVFACHRLDETEPVFQKFCVKIVDIFKGDHVIERDDNDYDGDDVIDADEGGSGRGKGTPVKKKIGSAGSTKKGVLPDNAKTQMCANKDTCKFGKNCHFAHSEEEMKQARANKAKRKSAASSSSGAPDWRKQNKK